MNVLQDLIKPPNFLRSLKNHVTGETNISNVLPTGQLSVNFVDNKLLKNILI